MGQIIILGTANAVSDEEHENTHLAIRQGESTVLVDCVGNPMARLKRAGIDPNDITDLILTHFHPDHVSSAPLLLMDMWLLGRKRPLRLHGLADTLDRFKRMMDLFEWKRWPDFLEIEYHSLPETELAEVILTADLSVRASPVKHLLPTIGLRIDFLSGGHSAAYSCDTEPSEAVVRLAGGVNVLIHEATAQSVGHSSAEQAGQVATRSGVERLILIHYTPPSRGGDTQLLLEQARHTFSGPVELARDFQVLEL